MRLKDEQAAELRIWATGRLEPLTQTNPKILADYAVQLLNGDTHIEDARTDVVAGLQDFLLEDTAQFVAELFVKATSHLRPPESAPSAPAASRLANRNQLPPPQAQSALTRAAPLSHPLSGPRKRKYAQATGNEDQIHHIGNHQVTKRVRGTGAIGDGNTRGNWRRRGRDNQITTSANLQPIGLRIGAAPFNLPNPLTPPGMPDFMAMYPYMALMMASGQGMMKKKGECEYFDAHRYCMRGDACPHKHTKQTPDLEARDEIGGYARDTEGVGGLARRKAKFTYPLPKTADTPTTRTHSRNPSYSANEASATPEPDKLQTPGESEMDFEAFNAEQIIKQQNYEARVAALNENRSHKSILAQKWAEIEAGLAAEKSKLQAMLGGDKTLIQINVERKKTDATNSKASIVGQVLNQVVEADLMSLGGTPNPPSRRASSIQSGAVGYLGKNQVICRYFPNCTNRTCTFKHTAASPASVVLCKFFPNCTNRGCTFKHVTTGPTSDVMCKFSSNCAKEGCTFKHPGGRPTSNVQCKFHPDCTNDACTFKHGDGSMFDIDCQYYSDCTNPRCGFKHPRGSISSGAVKRVDNRPKNLLISGVSASFNNGADSMNMVRVAVMAISRCESIQLQSYHDPNSENSGEEAHDGLVVMFAEWSMAEAVLKRLTMVGGVGRVKFVWYTGPIDGVMGGTPRTELEIDSVYGGDADMKMDVKIKDEDFDVAGEDEWAQISSSGQ